MILSRGHLSVLEHAAATFRILGLSRAATHQLVRHRLCSFSQRSQRYVKENTGAFVVPPSVESRPEALEVYLKALNDAAEAYRRLVDLKVRKEDARFVLPNATPSDLVLSANFRELRHVILTRGSREAQWEIREMAVKMLEALKEEAPNAFGDLEIAPDGSVTRSTPGRDRGDTQPGK
jgi:thymidylate synthase (FAD)